MAAASSTGSSRAIRAGRAFVEILAEDNQLYRALGKARDRLNGFGAFLTRTGAAGVAAGSAILSPFAGALTESVKRSDEISNLSAQLGTTTESLSRLGYAALKSGGNLETVIDVAKDLQKNISESSMGNQELARAFARLGLSGVALKSLALEDQFAAMGDALARVIDPTERMELAMKLLGEGGRKMLPAILGGADALREFGRESDQVGYTLRKEDAANAAKAMDLFTKAYQSGLGIVYKLGAVLADNTTRFDRLATRIVEGSIAVREWIAANSQLVTNTVVVGGALVAGGVALIALGGAMSGAAAAASALGAAFVGVKSGVLLAVSPVGLLVAGLGALSYWFVTTKEDGKQFAQSVGGYFVTLKDTAVESWGGIVDAVKSGDLELAGQIAVAGLNVAWAGMKVEFQKQWNGVKSIFVDGWHDAIMLAELGWKSFMNTIANGVVSFTEQIVNGFTDAFETVARRVSELFWDLGLGDTAKQVDAAIEEIRGIAKNGDAIRNVINKDTEAEKRKIIDAAQRAQQERDAARAADVSGLVGELDIARNEMRKLIDQAANNQGFELTTSDNKPPESKIPQLSEIALATRGSFNASNAAQAFGGERNTVPAKQLEEAKITNKKIDRLVDVAEEIRDEKTEGAVFT